ncbi:MAG: sulfite oxidase [Dehalococcoidia bacterium]|nr:MAG: sulfite oxidase [Dehalococcoidia bacterium]
MALFFVQHQHDAASCPAGDARTAPQLLQLLASAPQSGVTILADAVVDGAHQLNLIAAADQPATVERFMAPFAQFGSVDIRAASHCESVVDRGHC